MGGANFIGHTKDGFKETCVMETIERDTPMKGNYTEPIIIDNYNQRVPQDQDVIGTVTTQFGNPAPRHGYKIAEPLQIKQATKQGYIEIPPGSVSDASYPDSQTRRGRVQDGGQTSPTLMASGEAPCYYEGVQFNGVTIHEGEGLYTKASEKFCRSGIQGLSRALKASMHDAGVCQNYRIRKLTPRECFRLMGVSESDIDKIQASGVSQSQQYKQAGNSIVVDTLVQIFRKLFVDTGQESQQLSLF